MRFLKLSISSIVELFTASERSDPPLLFHPTGWLTPSQLSHRKDASNIVNILEQVCLLVVRESWDE